MIMKTVNTIVTGIIWFALVVLFGNIVILLT